MPVFIFVNFFAGSGRIFDTFRVRFFPGGRLLEANKDIPYAPYRGISVPKHGRPGGKNVPEQRGPRCWRDGILLPCLQGHRPDQQEQAGRKKSDGEWRQRGMHPCSKVSVNQVNKNRQSNELDNLRPSDLMTLQRCHASVNIALMVPFSMAGPRIGPSVAGFPQYIPRRRLRAGFGP